MTNSYLSVPTAGVVFPYEVTAALKSVAQYHYNIQRWTIKSSGGHFAALEVPEELVKDIREFRKQLTSQRIEL